MMKNFLFIFSLIFLFPILNAQERKLKIGDQAPEISLPTFEGDELSLSSLRGKVVLIDFWASWCGPCVTEQPELKKIYENYRSTDKFEILGVSLDRKRENWEKAIQKYSIDWPQISDLKYWMSPVAEDYEISDLPFNVMVDEAGKIIAFDLHGEDLENFLNAYFKKSN